MGGWWTDGMDVWVDGGWVDGVGWTDGVGWMDGWAGVDGWMGGVDG